MLKKLEKIYDEKIIKWFYILLPIIEVITSYMVIHMNTSITIGLVYKTLFLIYALVYLIFVNKDKRKSTYGIIALVGLSVLVNFFTTIESFTISNIIVKISELCKYITFPIVMLFFYKYIKNGNKIHLRTLVYSATVYSVVMIIAQLTGTEYPTYSGTSEFGHSGWYYSGNEISALLAMFYPIIIYFASKYRNGGMIFALSTTTYGLLALGTKASFVALAITIITIFMFEIFMIIKTRSKLSKNMLFTVFILLIVLIASAPYSPSLKYVTERINIAKSSVITVEGEEVTTNKVLESFVYNGRQLDVEEQSIKYKNSSLVEKIFGLKDVNRIRSEEGIFNVIERDLHDIFFIYGIFGVIVYFLPILLIAIGFVKRLFSKFKTECNEKNFVMGISIVICLGISFIAGHVLLAPTVVMFLCVVLSKINMEEDYLHIGDTKSSKKKIAIFLPRLSIGGMERALINLINMSDLKKKYNIYLFVGYIKDKEYIEDIPKSVTMHVFCNGKWNLINKVITAIKMIALNVQLVFKDEYYSAICYGHNHGILASLARSASKNNIIFIHADLENRNKFEMDKLNRQVEFEKFKKVVCVSEKALRSFKNIFPNYRGTTTVINNYIDGKYILDMSLIDRDLTEEIKFDNITTFVHVSRQEERSKKISRIIESSKRLKEENYNFQVLLIGEGEDTQSYKEKIKECGLEDTILMLGKKKNPYVYIKNSSALLFTSLFEGYGIVLDEARVLNTPIVSTDVSDAKMMAKEGYGILCENSEDGVYIGMKQFLDEGYKIKKEFDYNKFNNVITNKLNDIVKER